MVRKDIDACSLVADDVVPEAFIGVQANNAGNLDNWVLGFPNIETYRDGWLASTSDQADFAEGLHPAIPLQLPLRHRDCRRQGPRC